MKSLLKYAAVLAPLYLAVWAVAYVVLFSLRGDELDFSRFFLDLRTA